VVKELDLRDFNINKITPSKVSLFRSLAVEVSKNLKEGHQIHVERLDAITSNPSVIISTSAPALKGNHVERALAHVQSISPILGLSPAQSAEFSASPQFQKTSSGIVSVHLQQQYKGISIYNMSETVLFDGKGFVRKTIGRSITVNNELDVLPKVSVKKAVLRAAEYLSTSDSSLEEEEDDFSVTDNEPRPCAAMGALVLSAA
jgi:Zn-dependent metalloprotease